MTSSAPGAACAFASVETVQIICGIGILPTVHKAILAHLLAVFSIQRVDLTLT
jgi:hypothetical protein